MRKMYSGLVLALMGILFVVNQVVVFPIIVLLGVFSALLERRLEGKDLRFTNRVGMYVLDSYRGAWIEYNKPGFDAILEWGRG